MEKPLFLKITAVLTALFIASDPGSGYASTPRADSAVTLSIPAAFGREEESFRGPSSKTILYIQDAHDSFEAQKNIASLVTHLTEKNGVKTVFEEGYQGPVPTDQFFGFIQDGEDRLKVSSFLLDKLRIGGAEYAHINRKTDFSLIGADHLEHYRQNIQAFRDASKKNADIEKDLTAILKEIESLAHQKFPKPLREWLDTRDRYEAGQLDLLAYVERGWKILETQPKGGDAKNTLPVITLLLAARNTPDEALAAEARAIDPRELFREITALDKSIADLFTSGEKETLLLRYRSALHLLKRLNQIEVSPAEYAASKEILSGLNTRELADFIARESAKSLVLSKAWEDNIKTASRFYELAHQRDDAIEQTLRNYLSGTDEHTAVLVYGGFHKAGILSILRRLGVSYRVITPHISGNDPVHENYYKKLMAEGAHDFEKTLFVSAGLAPKATRPPSAFVEPFGEAAVQAVYTAVASNPGTPVGLLEKKMQTRRQIQALQDVQSSNSAVVQPGIPQMARSELRASDNADDPGLLEAYPQLRQISTAWEEFMASSEEDRNRFLNAYEGGAFVRSPFQWMNFMKENWNLNPQSRILDVGSGNGLAAIAFNVLTGAQVTSIEIDPMRWVVLQRFLRFLKDQKNLEFPGVRFEQADFLDYPLENFDFIYFYYTHSVKNRVFQGEWIVNRLSEELPENAVFVSPGFYLSSEYSRMLIMKKDRKSFFAETPLDYSEVILPKGKSLFHTEEAAVLTPKRGGTPLKKGARSELRASYSEEPAAAGLNLAGTLLSQDLFVAASAFTKLLTFKEFFFSTSPQGTRRELIDDLVNGRKTFSPRIQDHFRSDSPSKRAFFVQGAPASPASEYSEYEIYKTLAELLLNMLEGPERQVFSDFYKQNFSSDRQFVKVIRGMGNFRGVVVSESYLNSSALPAIIRHEQFHMELNDFLQAASKTPSLKKDFEAVRQLLPVFVSAGGLESLRASLGKLAAYAGPVGALEKGNFSFTEEFLVQTLYTADAPAGFESAFAALKSTLARIEAENPDFQAGMRVLRRLQPSSDAKAAEKNALLDQFTNQTQPKNQTPPEPEPSTEEALPAFSPESLRDLYVKAPQDFIPSLTLRLQQHFTRSGLAGGALSVGNLIIIQLTEGASIRSTSLEIIDPVEFDLLSQKTREFLTSRSELRAETPAQLLGFDRSTPVWDFLSAFGIDPAQSEVETLEGPWGRVPAAQHGGFGVEAGSDLREAVLESAFAVFDSREIRERLKEQSIPEDKAVDFLYLLTFEKIPVSLVWAIPGEPFQPLFYYPLAGPGLEPLWKGSSPLVRTSINGPQLPQDLESFIRAHHKKDFGKNPVLQGGLPISMQRYGLPGGTLREFEEGLAFPTVFSLNHQTSKGLVETVGRLIAAGIFSIEGETVSEVGTGAGWIAAQMALRGAADVHAYDLNLMKAANAAQTARRHGVAGRVHAYRARSAKVLPPSRLYLWNIPDFADSSSRVPEHKILNQSESIAVNNRIPQESVLRVFQELSAKARPDSLFLVRTHPWDEPAFFEMLKNSGWEIHPAFEKEIQNPGRGGSFFLLRPVLETEAAARRAEEDALTRNFHGTPEMLEGLRTVAKDLQPDQHGFPVLLIEGLPGSGKSSRAKDLKAVLESQGRKAVVIHSEHYLLQGRYNKPIRAFFGLLTRWIARQPNEDLFDYAARAFVDTARVERWISDINSLRAEGGLLTIDRDQKIQEKLTPDTVLIIEGTLSSHLFRKLSGAKRLFLDVPAKTIRNQFVKRTLFEAAGGPVYGSFKARLMAPGIAVSFFRRHAARFDFILKTQSSGAVSLIRPRITGSMPQPEKKSKTPPRSELRTRSPLDLTDEEKQMILDSSKNGYMREGANDETRPVWLFGETDVIHPFTETFIGQTSGTSIDPALFMDKKVLVMPGYGNLPFILRAFGAREVVASDIDPVTIAWQKLKWKSGVENLNNWLFVSESSRLMIQSAVRQQWLLALNKRVDPRNTLDHMTFQTADILSPLPVQGELYDLIVVPYLFGFAHGLVDESSWNKALANMSQALAPGGRIILTPGDLDLSKLTDSSEKDQTLEYLRWLRKLKNQGWDVNFSTRYPFQNILGHEPVQAAFAVLSRRSELRSETPEDNDPFARSEKQYEELLGKAAALSKSSPRLAEVLEFAEALENEPAAESVHLKEAVRIYKEIVEEHNSGAYRNQNPIRLYLDDKRGWYDLLNNVLSPVSMTLALAAAFPDGKGLEEASSILVKNVRVMRVLGFFKKQAETGARTEEIGKLFEELSLSSSGDPLDKTVSTSYGSYTLRRIIQQLEVKQGIWMFGPFLFEDLDASDRARVEAALSPETRERLKIFRFIDQAWAEYEPTAPQDAGVEKLSSRKNSDALAALLSEIFSFGKKYDAYGVSNGFQDFLQVLFEGKVRSRFRGSLTDHVQFHSDTAGSHGPFYILFKTSVLDPDERANHRAYLVPESSDKEAVSILADRAAEEGLITKAAADDIKAKLITYQTFAELHRSELRAEEIPPVRTEEVSDFFEELRSVFLRMPPDFRHEFAIAYEFKTPEEVAAHFGGTGDTVVRAVLDLYLNRGFMMGEESTTPRADAKPLYSRTLWIDPANPGFRFGAVLELLKRGTEVMEGIYDQRDTEAAAAFIQEALTGTAPQTPAQTLGLAGLAAWRNLLDKTIALDQRLSQRSELRSEEPKKAAPGKNPPKPVDELKVMRASLRHYLRRQIEDRTIDPNQYEFVFDILPYRILAAKDARGKILGFAFGKKGNRHMHSIVTEKDHEPDGFIYEKDDHGIRIITYVTEGDKNFKEDVFVLGRFGDVYRLKIEESGGHPSQQSIEYHNWMPSYMLTRAQEVEALSRVLGPQLYEGVQSFIPEGARLVLAPGMEPEARMTYWPSIQGSVRSREEVFGGLDHEGFDVAHIRHRSGAQEQLAEGTSIRSLVNEPGRVQWTFEDNVQSTAIVLSGITLPVGSKRMYVPKNPDDMGRVTIGAGGAIQFPEGVEYEVLDTPGEKYRVAFVYTHLALADWVRPGAEIAAGDERIIGTIEKHRRYPYSPVVPHLHFAVMLFKESEIEKYSNLNYEILNRKLGPDQTVLYVNPLSLLDQEQRGRLFVEGPGASSGFGSAAIQALNKDALKSVRARVSHTLLGIPVWTAAGPGELTESMLESDAVIRQTDAGWQVRLNSRLSADLPDDADKTLPNEDALILHLKALDLKLRQMRETKNRSELRSYEAEDTLTDSGSRIELSSVWEQAWTVFGKRAFSYENFTDKVTFMSKAVFQSSFQDLQKLGLAAVDRKPNVSGRPLRVRLTNIHQNGPQGTERQRQRELVFLISQLSRPGDEEIIEPWIRQILSGESLFALPFEIPSYEDQEIALAGQGYDFPGILIVFRTLKKLFGREYAKAVTLAEMLKKTSDRGRSIRALAEDLEALGIAETLRKGSTGSVWIRLSPKLDDSQLEKIEKALLEASRFKGDPSLSFKIRNILERKSAAADMNQSAVIKPPAKASGLFKLTLPAVVRAIEEEEIEQRRQGESEPSVRLNQIAARLGVSITAFHHSLLAEHADLRRLGIQGLALGLPVDESKKPEPGKKKPLNEAKARPAFQTMIRGAVSRLRGSDPDFAAIPIRTSVLARELGLSDTGLRDPLKELDLLPLLEELGVFSFKPASPALEEQAGKFVRSLGLEPSEVLAALVLGKSGAKRRVDALSPDVKRVQEILDRWQNEQELRRVQRRKAYVESLQTNAVQNYESAVSSQNGIDDSKKILQVMNPNHPVFLETALHETSGKAQTEYLVPDENRAAFETNFKIFQAAFLDELTNLKMRTQIDFKKLLAAAAAGDRKLAAEEMSLQRWTSFGSFSLEDIFRAGKKTSAFAAFWKAWDAAEGYPPLAEEMTKRLDVLRRFYQHRSELRITDEETLKTELRKNTSLLHWQLTLSAYMPEKESERVEIAVQIDRGIRIRLSAARSLFTDPEFEEAVHRYIAAWIYNLSIVYGTSFAAAGAEEDPSLVDTAKIETLLTKGDLSSIRESLSKGMENPLGISSYANAGRPVRIMRLTELTDEEKKIQPVALQVKLQTQVPGTYLGIDIGGGSAKWAVLQDGKLLDLPKELKSSTTLLMDSASNPVYESPEDYVLRLITRARDILDYLKKTYGIEKIDGVGIDIPGAADFNNNTMVTLGQIPVKKEWNQDQVTWTGREIPRRLAEALGLEPLRVKIRNDMDGVLPGVASVLPAAKKDFWERTGGHFGFDWMGTGHGNQYAVAGVPMNAPTESGHMTFEFGQPGQPLFDTEAYTSIPSMLIYARELVRKSGKGWPDISGDQLKPLADQAFYEGADALQLERKTIALKVFERFAEKYAANLALRYVLAESSGFGNASEILLGGGIARGRTGALLRDLTLKKLRAYGLDGRIQITVIQDDDIRKAGLDPDDVGPAGSAYFIQSLLAPESADGEEFEIDPGYLESPAPASNDDTFQSLARRFEDRRLSWIDPAEKASGARIRHAAAAASFKKYVQWKTGAQAVPLLSDYHFTAGPSEEEIRAFPDLKKLVPYDPDLPGRRPLFGSVSGSFFTNEAGQRVFLVSIIQTGVNWKLLERATKNRYDPIRGASLRPEGNLYSWYGSLIAALEETLRSEGVNQIAVLSFEGVREIRSVSGVKIGDAIADKMYGKPGPGYETARVKLRDAAGGEHNLAVWKKELSGETSQRSELRESAGVSNKGTLMISASSLASLTEKGKDELFSRMYLNRANLRLVIFRDGPALSGQALNALLKLSNVFVTAEKDYAAAAQKQAIPGASVILLLGEKESLASGEKRIKGVLLKNQAGEIEFARLLAFNGGSLPNVPEENGVFNPPADFLSDLNQRILSALVVAYSA